MRTSENWSEDREEPCSFDRHLLCLETGVSERTPVPWVPAALVFTTSAIGAGDLGSWPEAGNATGLAAGDAICRQLATAAQLPAPESFVAWLSADSVDAPDRWTLVDGVPIRRVDGFRIADSRDDLLAFGSDNTLHVDEQGRYLGGLADLWTGTSDGGTATTQTCEAWTSAMFGDNGTDGVSNYAYGFEWTEFPFGSSCTNFRRLVCFSNVEVLFWDGFELTGNTERWSAAVP